MVLHPSEGRMSESLSKIVARNTLFSVLGYLASICVLFVLTPYVIGKLGPNMYGIWVIISVLTGYFGLTDLGIGYSFQKFVAEYYAQRDLDSINKIVNSGFVFYTLLGTLLLAAAFIFVDPLFKLLDIPNTLAAESRVVFLVATLNLAMANLISVFASIMTGLQHIDLVKKIELSLLLGRVVLYVLVLEQGFGIMGLILSETCLLLFSAALNYFFLIRFFPEVRIQPWRLDFRLFRKLLDFGGKLQISRLSELVNFQFDRIIVSKFVGLEYVVFADVGGKLLNKIRVLPLILLSSLIPAVSQLQSLNQTERIRIVFDRSSKYLVVSSVPLFVFAFVFAHLIMRVWFASSFSMAAITMQILTLGYLFNVLTGSISFVSQGIGNVTPQMWVAIIQTVTNVVLSILLVLHFGYYGVMIGTTISLIVGAVYFVIAFNRMLKGSLQRILSTLKLPVLASGVSVLFALLPWFIEGFAAHRRAVDLGLLIVSGLMFLLVYFVVLRVGRYFDEWDGEFLLSISPKLSIVNSMILSRREVSQQVGR